MKFNKKQKFIYLALIPFLLAVLMTLIPIALIQLVAVAILYLLIVSWIFYLIFIWIRWIAGTAEKAGRSYVGFMIFGIFLPIFASIVVLTFKQDDEKDKIHE